MEKDNCQVCKGERGGTKGNGNIVDGVIMCDYCHADTLRPHTLKNCWCLETNHLKDQCFEINKKSGKVV